MRLFYLLACFVLFQVHLPAQNRQENQAQFQVHISKATKPVQIDGVLDDAAWQTAEPAQNFWIKWPRDNEHAATRTEMRLTYDAHFLYIAASCFDSTRQYIIQNLKRDVGYWDSDGIAVVLDPANKATNGYFFGLTPAGAQTEGLLSTGGEDNFTWDNRWYAEVKHTDEGWTAEFAIPFQIIRFGDGAVSWGINFIRNDASNGQWHTWTKMPLQFEGTDLGFTGQLIWDAPPKREKGNYNFSPYVSTAVSRDLEAKEDYKVKPGLGMDAKIGIGTALNLDLTINPDFSQIEIDEQVVNLTRFDVQLPEKRTFFLESADLFGNFGIGPIRPFFSRRIGLDPEGRQIPILGGVRLTGNINASTRIGLLNMQTAARNGNLSQNFSALTFNRRVLTRSSINGYFLNKQSFKGSEVQKGEFARNAGLEFSFTSNDGKWNYWATTHGSFKPDIKGKNFWGNSGVQYNSRRFDLLVDFLRMGENYYAEQGFEARIENYDVISDSTVRIGYNFIYSEGNLRFMPQNRDQSRLNLTELGFTNFSVRNPNGSLNEQYNALEYRIFFKNTQSIIFTVDHTEAQVPVSFKFDDSELEECPALPASHYQYSTMALSWSTDTRKQLLMETNLLAGGFYNGNQVSASIGLRYRVQPWGNFALRFQYNLLDFPDPYCDLEFFNITPRIEIFINRNLNWTTFVQYNTQADNFNINSRLQWRYRPMSDLYVVFTDNYAVKVWGAKNRAFVIKWNYWL